MSGRAGLIGVIMKDHTTVKEVPPDLKWKKVGGALGRRVPYVHTVFSPILFVCYYILLFIYGNNHQCTMGLTLG